MRRYFTSVCTFCSIARPTQCHSHEKDSCKTSLEQTLKMCWIEVNRLSPTLRKPKEISTTPSHLNKSLHPHIFQWSTEQVSLNDDDQCDCSRCVRHLLDLVESERGQQSISQARLRYHSLPGMNLRPATATKLRRLQESFAARAATRRLACSCRSCVVHHQFVAVWRATLEINRGDVTREPRSQ